MPDQTVKVTFTDPNTFTFDPPSHTMTAAGKVILNRSPGSANWTFVSVNELSDPPFTWSVKGNGSSMHIDDAFTSNGEFHYTVTVHDATGNHTSGNDPRDTFPPMIVNE